MLITAYGPGCYAWRMVGTERQWTEVYIQAVSEDGRWVTECSIRRARGTLMPWGSGGLNDVYGPPVEIPASLAIPAYFVRYANKARKRHAVHGATWCWRADASPAGQDYDLDLITEAPDSWFQYPNRRITPGSAPVPR